MNPVIPAPPVAGLTRRELLKGGLAIGLLAAAGCSPAPDDPKEGSGARTFTDDRGEVIELPAGRPRVVAYENAAGSLIPLGIRPVGVFGGSALQDSPQLEGLDTEGIEAVGIEYGVINFEQLAALKPDVIVTLFDPAQTGPAFGFVENGEELARKIAPVLVVDGGAKADPEPTIKRFVELASALGAEPGLAAVGAQKSRFEGAIAALKQASAANPGVKVLALQPYAGDLVYFGRPERFASLRLFREAGVDLVVPEGGASDPNTDFVGYFWDAVSFELAGKYPADLLLVGNNSGAMTPEQIAADPSFKTVPAASSGQMVIWRTIDSFSYDRFAQDIQALASGLARAKPDLAP